MTTAFPPGYGRLGGSVSGGAFFGEQQIIFTDPSSLRTVIAGSGAGVILSGDLAWRLGSPTPDGSSRDIEPYFDWSTGTIKGLSRTPPTSTTGNVTSDLYDVKSTRSAIGVRVKTWSKNLAWSVGAERSSASFDLDRSLDIDFSAVQPSTTLHFDGRTELSETSWRIAAGLAYQANPTIVWTFDGAAGTDSWRIAAGVGIRLR